jgi:hypothetical protein
MHPHVLGERALGSLEGGCAAQPAPGYAPETSFSIDQTHGENARKSACDEQLRRTEEARRGAS